MQFLTRKGYDYSGQHEKERKKGLKKIVSVLICLLCVAGAYAVTYGSSYRGTGRNSYVATGYHSAATGLSQTPAATMRSTSSVGYSPGYARTAPAKSSMTVMPVQGLYTSASAVRGGVTTYDSGPNRRGPRRASSSEPPSPGDQGYCDGCHYVWSTEANAGDGGWVCDRCGRELEEGCDCASGGDYCHCPVGDGMDVLVMMFALAMTYGIFKVRKGKNELPEC